jgi:hypothetical protein
MATRTNSTSRNKKFRVVSGTTVMGRQRKKQIKNFNKAVGHYNKRSEGFVGDLFGTDFINQEKRKVYGY